MTKVERTCSRCGLVFVSDKLDGMCPSCLLTNTLDIEERGDERAFWEEELPVSAPGRGFSHFELIEELGRGGMGTVYRARDHVTERTVALKVLQAHHLNEPDLIQRFRSEVRAVTSLDHRHILPIHEVGEHDGIPFFSMKLATGGSLAQRLPEYLGYPRKAAHLLAKIARGVQHAHEHGILHRDLKPGNILLDDAGEPYVCDFGLAKWLEDDRRLTITSAVLGTPHYIAPEQANGKGSLTIAADIYSLGAVLYEMLTGRPPFVGETVIDTLRQASECTPAKPSSIVNHTPRDLETVCLKALEREPTARYRTAAAFADDLENWLSGRPIRARPVSAAEQLWRWARRNPLPATLGGILAVAITALAVGATIAAVQINHSRTLAEAAKKDATEKLYGSLLAQARASRMTDLAGHRIEALEAIQKAATIHPSLELRNEAIAALTLVDLAITKRTKIRENSTLSLAFDATLETIAVATKAGDITISRLTDGTNLQTITGIGKPILSLVHSGQRYLAGRTGDGGVYVWDLGTGKLIREFPGHPIPRQLGSYAADCFFSPDERFLAIGSLAGIEVIDVNTGGEIARLRTAHATYLAFDPSGTRLAFGGVEEKTVNIWNFSEQLPVINLPLPSQPTSIVWNSDHNRLAVGCSDFSIQIVDTANGQITSSLLGHRQEVTQAIFNHRGDILASTSRDRTIRLWDLQTNSELVELPKHGSEPALKFAPDDRHLSATDGSTSAVMIEIAGSNRVCTAFAPKFGKEVCEFVSSVDYSRDSALLATASTRTLQFFDAKKGVRLLTVPIDPATQTNLRFLADGKTLMVLSRRTGLTVYHYFFRDGKLELNPGENRQQFLSYILGSAQSDPSTNFCLTSNQESTGVVWDPYTNKVIQTLSDQSAIQDMVVSPDNKWIVTSYTRRDRLAQVWAFPSGQHQAELAGGRAGLLAFSPNGRWLASSGSGADHVLWNTGSWTKGPALPPQVEAETGRFTFSYDEKFFAAAMFDQIGLVSLPEGELLALLEQRIQPTPICRVRFSPDGSQLAAQGVDNSLIIWNINALRKELQQLNLNW